MLEWEAPSGTVGTRLERDLGRQQSFGLRHFRKDQRPYDFGVDTRRYGNLHRCSRLKFKVPRGEILGIKSCMGHKLTGLTVVGNRHSRSSPFNMASSRPKSCSAALAVGQGISNSRLRPTVPPTSGVPCGQSPLPWHSRLSVEIRHSHCSTPDQASGSSALPPSLRLRHIRLSKRRCSAAISTDLQEPPCCAPMERSHVCLPQLIK